MAEEKSVFQQYKELIRSPEVTEFDIRINKLSEAYNIADKISKIENSFIKSILFEIKNTDWIKLKNPIKTNYYSNSLFDKVKISTKNAYGNCRLMELHDSNINGYGDIPVYFNTLYYENDIAGNKDPTLKAELINILMSHTSDNGKILIDRFIKFQSDCKKIGGKTEIRKRYYLQNMDSEVKEAFSRCMPARTRNNMSAKINVQFKADNYGVRIGFPSLMYYNSNETDEHSRDSKEIMLGLFKKKHIKKLNESLDNFIKFIDNTDKKYVELFDKTYEENSIYFVLNEIRGDDE